MRSAIAAAALIAAAAIAAPAAARGPMYAHKAGIDEATLNADESACLDDANKAMRDPAFRQPYMYNPVTEGTVAGAAGAGIARGFAEGMASGKRFNTTLYDCLIGRGYTMRRMSDADWKALKKLPEADRKAQALAWRIAPEPVHPEVTRDSID